MAIYCQVGPRDVHINTILSQHSSLSRIISLFISCRRQSFDEPKEMARGRQTVFFDRIYTLILHYNVVYILYYIYRGPKLSSDNDDDGAIDDGNRLSTAFAVIMVYTSHASARGGHVSFTRR